MRRRAVGLGPIKDRYRALCRCGAPIEWIRESLAPDGHWVHLGGGELCFEDDLAVAEPADRTR